jgi:ferredoxin
LWEIGLVENAFEIVLHKSGRTLQVLAEKSILETLQDAGFDPAFSCQQGICGTCETKVLSGVPDHRDMFLNDAEQASNTVMMICCSRSKTPKMVLDL